MSTSELPRFLTLAEVAELLRTPMETVRYWRFVGKGPASFKLEGSRRVLYAREDVEAWLAAAVAADAGDEPATFVDRLADIERRLAALEAGSPEVSGHV